MGYWNYTVLKGCTEQQFRETLQLCAQEKGGYVLWDSDAPVGNLVGIRSNGDTHSVSIACDEDDILGEVAERLGCLMLYLFVQDSNHWDYNLLRGRKSLSYFSTVPEYFTSDPLEQMHARANVDLFASEWGVPRERIENYLVQWRLTGTSVTEGPLPNMHTVHMEPETGEVSAFEGVLRSNYALTGKAYPGDEYEYGDYWQVLDFLKAVGGDMAPHFLPGEVYDTPPDPGSRTRLVLPAKCADPQGWFARLKNLFGRKL